MLRVEAEEGNNGGGENENPSGAGAAVAVQDDNNEVQAHRMDLTAEERAWAKRIKAAVEDTPELDNLSDYMYAQMAIVSRIDDDANDDITNIALKLPLILARFQTMQNHKQESGVVDDYGQGYQMLDRLICHLVPGSYLDYSYHLRENAYVCTTSMTHFDMTVLADPEKFKHWLAASYYMFHAFNPDFEATRNGLIILAECEGYHWKGRDMVHTKAFRQWWEELALVYPLYVQKVKYFHTGLFLNLLLSTARRFLPAHVRRRMDIGCRSEAGRLDEIFLQPNPDVANARLVGRLQEALQLYYRNEASFVL